jgi:ferrous iron transport protein B
MTATAFYQAATYPLHPVSSIFWGSGFLVFFSILVLILRRWGEREASPGRPV